MLTGYIGNELFLNKIANIVKELKSIANIKYGMWYKIVYRKPNEISKRIKFSPQVCDPVLGDNGKMYVPESLISIYRQQIVPLADIVTPNQFEAEILSEIKIESEENAWKSLDWFHNKGVQVGVITSTSLSASTGFINIFLSVKTKTSHDKYKLEVPVLGNGLSFGGTGDLFTALFLAHSEITNNFSIALEKASATLHEVIKNTLNELPNEVLVFQRLCRPDEKELRIIQSKAAIENPKNLFSAKNFL